MKETYYKIEKWIQDNPELTEMIRSHKYKFTDKTNFDIEYLINWYEDVREYKDILLGDVIITLNDIDNKIHKYYNVTCKVDFIEMISGNWDDDLRWDDIDKALCYIEPELFNYIYYTLKWSKEQFKKNIYNSMQFNDEISTFYPPNADILGTKSFKEEIVKLKEEEIKKYAGFVVKYPLNMKQEADNSKALELIGLSIIDFEPVYRIKIPFGCEIVHNIKEHIPNDVLINYIK